ncbi:hypothetical protein M9H77_06900 [Catharanthus roseus]|uniref:Uncharacterized protein n=1 Tax=Catharanthus roseus TaxID=4058 RepID=A0ACC0BTD6_CATRO|nr:hypothetical protein M9H77_06900 [Catharanthus roseus]
MPNSDHEQDLLPEVGQPTADSRCIGNKRREDITSATTNYWNNSRVVELCPFLERFDTRVELTSTVVVVLVYASTKKGELLPFDPEQGCIRQGPTTGVHNVEAISIIEARLTAIIEQKLGNLTTRSSSKPNQMVLLCDSTTGGIQIMNAESTESSPTDQGKSRRVDDEVYECNKQQNEYHQSCPKESGSLH